MADMTSDTNASAGTGQTPQSQPTSTETSPQSASTTGSTSSTPAPVKDSGQGGKPNLFESEEFRKYQSQQEKRIAQERANYQREMAALRQQMQQVQLQSAPEEERVVIERDQLRQQLQQFQQEQQRQAQLSQQWQDLDKMAKIAGMKTEDLFSQNFRDIGEAAFYVLENMTTKQKAEFEKSVEAAIAERERKKEANAVDLGSGAAVTTDDIKHRKLNDSLKRRDGKSFVLELLSQGQ